MNQFFFTTVVGECRYGSLGIFDVQLWMAMH